MILHRYRAALPFSRLISRRLQTVLLLGVIVIAVLTLFSPAAMSAVDESVEQQGPVVLNPKRTNDVRKQPPAATSKANDRPPQAVRADRAGWTAQGSANGQKPSHDHVPQQSKDHAKLPSQDRTKRPEQNQPKQPVLNHVQALSDPAVADELKRTRLMVQSELEQLRSDLVEQSQRDSFNLTIELYNQNRYLKELLDQHKIIDSGAAAKTAMEHCPSTKTEERVNAVILSVVRNRELDDLLATMESFERTFNSRYRYPYAIFNDQPFTQEFIDRVRNATQATVEFALIPKEHWSLPSFIDPKRAHREMARQEFEGYLYGGLESYHHMCRWNSGFFYKHPLMEKYEYYWRIEPSTDYYCYIDFDPFLLMKKNNKVYGFTIIANEYLQTVRGLWKSTMDYIKLKKGKAVPRHLMAFHDTKKNDYNGIHFWTNFEIADLKWFRSKEYNDYFDYLDRTGGFFFERWGDAPVHTLAAGLLLNENQMHYFYDIGYRHSDRLHCPQDIPSKGYIVQNKCTCDLRQKKYRDLWAYRNDPWRGHFEHYMEWLTKYWS